MIEKVSGRLSITVVEHHLRLMGLSSDVGITLFEKDCNTADVLAALQNEKVCVLLGPSAELSERFGVSKVKLTQNSREVFWSGGAGQSFKTLHEMWGWEHSDGEAVISEKTGMAVWLWLKLNRGGLLFIGTDMVGDLIRFRQGDPSKAQMRPTDVMWGISGERPVYLFEEQLGGNRYARDADLWAMALARTLAEVSGAKLHDILPGGAPGAVVVTGDDDQAFLGKYDEQLTILGDIPITYLLHPLTRHNRKTLYRMRKRNRGVDFGIHPDALDTPDNYRELFHEQVLWYQKLVGCSPLSLRNHGFLNDGYWGHLPAWLDHDVAISSNLPGLDGRILTGSLLPARMVWNGKLTSHWSVLTAIGDGVRFVSGMSDQDAGYKVLSFAESIRSSGIPGVMVLNLHPQNVSETRAMHEAVKEVIRSGFVAWNLQQCLDWFSSRDGETIRKNKAKTTWLSRRLASMRSRFI